MENQLARKHITRSDQPALIHLAPVLLILALVALMLGIGASAAYADGAVSITLTSQETLWLDANKCNARGPRGAWLSFVVTNTGATTLDNVVVSFAGFTGANATYFVTPSDLTRTFSTLEPAQAVPVYYYVDYAEVCNHSQGGSSPFTGYTANYTISVASPTLTTDPTVYNGTVTTGDLHSAAAAGIAQSFTLGPGTYVGQIMTETVAYSFGKNTHLFFQPAGDAGFQDECIRLVGSQITAVSGNVSTSLIGQKDRLYFPNASVARGGGTISVTYSWEILCGNTSQIAHPWAAAKTSQKYRYESFGVAVTLPLAQSPLSIAKSVTPTVIAMPAPGDTVTYAVVFTNTAPVPIVLKSITDLLPACMTLANPSASGSQVTAANSSSIPTVGVTGRLQWVGKSLGNSADTTYQVPATGTLTLIYTAYVANCPVPSTQPNSASGLVGSTVVGPTNAAVGFGVVPVSALTLTKSVAETSYDAVGDVLHYTYLVTNTGNVSLLGPVTVSDNKVTVTCPNVNTVGNLDEYMDPGESITCTASYAITQADLDAGSVINEATASGNGVTSNQATATVTAVQTKSLLLTKSARPATYSAGQVIAYTYVATNTGNVTLSGPVTIADDKLGTFRCGTATSLAPGASVVCTKSYTIQPGDLSDRATVRYPPVPTNATITSAKFEIYLQKATHRTVRLHRITAPWTEMGVTWNNFGTASYDPAVIGSFTTDAVGWRAVDITALAQAWANGTWRNYGLLLEQGEEGLSAYNSSEHAPASLRPRLTICYTTPTTPNTCVVIQRSASKPTAVPDTFIWQGAPNTNYSSSATLYTGSSDDSSSASLSTDSLDCRSCGCSCRVKQSLIRFNLNTAIINRATATAAFDATTVTSNEAQATITALVTNVAPVAVNDGYTTAEDTALTVGTPAVLANDTDADLDGLNAALVAGPTHGALTLHPDGSFVYTPTLNYNGPDSFTYRATDSLANSNVATVTLTVTPVNDAPVAMKDHYTTAEDIVLTVGASGILANDTDVDGDALSAVLDKNPTHGTLTLYPNGSFVYTPTLDYNGSDCFTYHATDGSLSSNGVKVTLTVTPVNDPPVAVDDLYTALEDGVLTVAAPGVLGNDTDADGDRLNAVLDAGPAHGTLTLRPNGSFVYTPTLLYHGPDSFTYHATGGLLNSNVATVTLNVTHVNHVPVAVNDSYTTAEDTVLTVGAPGLLTNDTDVDGDTLNATLEANPAHGTLALQPNGSFVYTPTLDYNGPDSFTYRATDGSLSSNVATVTLTVTIRYDFYLPLIELNAQ